jgi:hypothetical protein
VKALRAAAVASFVLGAALLGASIACGGKGDAVSHPFVPIDSVPSATFSEVAEETVSPTLAATATPTPTPYAGAVARLKIPRFNVD